MHQITESFQLNSNVPIDARFQCDTIADLIAIPSNRLYDGIIVYVPETRYCYMYDSQTTLDPDLQHWRKMEVYGVNINSTYIDKNDHLIVKYNDSTLADLGHVRGAKGDKGDTGDSFAIARIYDDPDVMVNDPAPVADGKMVALKRNNSMQIYVRDKTTKAGGDNYDGYYFFSSMDDMSTIKGDKGDKGADGKDGTTPTITVTPVPQTSTSNAGNRLDFYLDDATTPAATYTVYDGSSPVVTQTPIPESEDRGKGYSFVIQNGRNKYSWDLYDGKDGTNGIDGVSVIDAYVDNRDPDSPTYHHLLCKLSNNTIVDAGPVDIQVANLDFLIEIVDELPEEPQEGKIYVYVGSVNPNPRAAGEVPSSGGDGSGAIFFEDFFTTKTLPDPTDLQPTNKVITTDNLKIHTVTDLYTYEVSDAKEETLYGCKKDSKLYILNHDGQFEKYSDQPTLNSSDKNILKYVDGELYAEADKITFDPATDNTITYGRDGKSLYVPSPKPSADAGNILQAKSDGLYVEELKLSADPENSLSMKDDGLFGVGSNISSDITNAIVKRDDGLYVPQLQISADANNAVEKHDDGVYVKATLVSQDKNNLLEEHDDGLYAKSTYVSKQKNNGIIENDDGLYVDFNPLTKSEEDSIVNDIISAIFDAPSDMDAYTKASEAELKKILKANYYHIVNQ